MTFNEFSDVTFPIAKKFILAGESVFVSDEDLGQRGPEHTPWKRRQPVRTLVNIGDHASGEASGPVRADGSATMRLIGAIGPIGQISLGCSNSRVRDCPGGMRYIS